MNAVSHHTRTLAAILLFGITWGISVWSAWTNNGYQAGMLQILLLPFYLFALIAWVERVGRFFRVARSWRGVRKSQSVADTLIEHRNAVVRSVADAV